MGVSKLIVVQLSVGEGPVAGKLGGSQASRPADVLQADRYFVKQFAYEGGFRASSLNVCICRLPDEMKRDLPGIEQIHFRRWPCLESSALAKAPECLSFQL